MNVHSRRQDREYPSRNDNQRRYERLRAEAQGVNRRRIIPRHAQAEKHSQELPESADGVKHRLDQTADISICVSGLPVGHDVACDHGGGS